MGKFDANEAKLLRMIASTIAAQLTAQNVALVPQNAAASTMTTIDTALDTLNAFASALVRATPISIGTRIDEGDMHEAGVYGSAVADDASIGLIITTGAFNTAHVFPTLAVDGDAEFEIFTGTSTTNQGASVTVRNHNQFSSSTGVPTVMESLASIAVLGTRIHHAVIPGGRGQQAGGAEGGRENQWILGKSTTYLFRVFNRAGAGKDMSLHLEWHDDTV